LRVLLAPLTGERLCKAVLTLVNLARAMEIISIEQPDFDFELTKKRFRTLTIGEFRALVWVNGKLTRTLIH
jgi:hypothetical protein